MCKICNDKHPNIKLNAKMGSGADYDSHKADMYGNNGEQTLKYIFDQTIKLTEEEDLKSICLVWRMNDKLSKVGVGTKTGDMPRSANVDMDAFNKKAKKNADALCKLAKQLSISSPPKKKSCKQTNKKAYDECEKRKKDGEDVRLNSKCQCVENKKKEPKVYYGCVDELASNFFCKVNPKICALAGFDLTKLQPLPCEYDYTWESKFQYFFCGDDTGIDGCDAADCGTDDTLCFTGTEHITTSTIKPQQYQEILKYMNGVVEASAEYFGDSPTSTYLSLPNNSPGFYGTPSETQKSELAKALTMAMMDNYTGQFPYKYIAIYKGGAGITPLGEFKVIKQGGQIAYLKSNNSNRALKRRLIPGTQLDINKHGDVNIINNWLRNSIGLDVAFQQNGIVENEIIGLEQVLIEAREGLVNLVK